MHNQPTNQPANQLTNLVPADAGPRRFSKLHRGPRGGTRRMGLEGGAVVNISGALDIGLAAVEELLAEGRDSSTRGGCEGQYHGSQSVEDEPVAKQDQGSNPDQVPETRTGSQALICLGMNMKLHHD